MAAMTVMRFFYIAAKRGMDVNLDYWRGFLETARSGSMAKASAKLGLTPPALGKQIRALEAYYGATLFNRTTAGVELTPEGSLLAGRLEPIVNAHEEMRQALESLQGNRNALTIGTIPSLSQRYVPKLYLRLQDAGYRVDVEVRHTSAEVAELLLGKKIDAALVERSAVSPSLWSRELVRETYHLLAPAGQEGARGKGPAPRDWMKQPLVVYPEGCTIRKAVERTLARDGLEIAVSKEIGFGESIPDYVAAGAGMAVLPLRSAGQLADPRLQAIPLADFPEQRIVMLAARSAQEGKRFLRHFTAAFQAT
ncbi:LysR family transcriptional regulator [Cohnella caldifontis]|uniref:LysR family transcriptional regulator n=1 Tax=Cohnella caldifontis TaxID=3027471 RepID=UPI0023ECAEB4|nr:LysR family transcriptional regulator [Cohnella sp. YIM B05605]